MIIGSILEDDIHEKRTLLTLETVKKFIQLGFNVNIENNFLNKKILNLNLLIYTN